MFKLIVVFISLAVLQSRGSSRELQKIEVLGDKEARVIFHTSRAFERSPSFRNSDGSIGLDLLDTNLADLFDGKLDLVGPHTLIRSISAFPAENDSVRVRIGINGSLEGLDKRVRIDNSNGGLQLVVKFPADPGGSLSLLSEEQKPLVASSSKSQHAEAGGTAKFVLIVIAMIGASGVGTFLLAKFLKKRGKNTGTRKFLIEQMGYTPLGNRSGIGLIKVGTELFLVGITPNSISLLSDLPKLQEQYSEETQFERGVFKEAYREEVDRLNNNA